MKRRLLITAAFVLLTVCLGVSSNAAIQDCDFSDPKNGTIDGSDLAAFAAFYAADNPAANVNKDGGVDSADVAYFAGFFGQTYTVTARAPNILLIIVDDVGIDVTTNLYPTTTTPPQTGLIDQLEAIYGSGVRGRPAFLPNLTDRLAKQGMVFSNAWAQPYCSPTRATVITGLFEDKTRVTGPDSPLIYNADPSKRHITFVKKLQDEGYSTAMIGKWHLAGSSPWTSGTLPKQAGFDYYRGHNAAYIPGYWSTANNNNNYPVHWQDSGTAAGSFNTIAAGSVPARSLPAGSDPVNDPEIPSTTYEPVVRAADTIDWINAHPDTPWFVWLAFNMSHVTVQPINMHVPPENMLDSDTKEELDACLGATGQYGVNPPTAQSVGSCTGKHLMRAMTNAIDTAIGKILNVVDSLDSPTYVIFMGDNGTPMYGNIGGVTGQIDNMYIITTNRGKGTVYESGCRVPLAIRGPGIAAGVQKSAPVHVADLSATILTLAGLTPPATNYDTTGAVVDSDSKSLTPILFSSANDTGRDPNAGYLLTETSSGGNKVGARNAKYKVLCTTNTNTDNCLFYDLLSDPLEVSPLAKPNCASPPTPPWDTDDPEWHYCQLIDVITDYSIFP